MLCYDVRHAQTIITLSKICWTYGLHGKNLIMTESLYLYDYWYLVHDFENVNMIDRQQFFFLNPRGLWMIVIGHAVCTTTSVLLLYYLGGCWVLRTSSIPLFLSLSEICVLCRVDKMPCAVSSARKDCTLGYAPFNHFVAQPQAKLILTHGRPILLHYQHMGFAVISPLLH